MHPALILILIIGAAMFIWTILWTLVRAHRYGTPTPPETSFKLPESLEEDEKPAPTRVHQPYKPLITIGANSEGRVVLTLGDPFGASTTLTCDPASMRKHANQLLAMCDLVEKKEEP